MALFQLGMGQSRAVVSNREVMLSMAFLALNALYFSVIFGTVDNPSCCDATLYLEGGRRLSREGLLFDNPYSGYRSIWNYGIAEAVKSVGEPFRILVDLPEKAAVSYAIGALLLYWLTAITLVMAFSKSAGFGAIFGAIYLNPVSLSYLLYPLQESQIVLVLAPIVVAVVVALASGQWGRAVVLLWVFAGLVWMVKGALILVALPVVGLALYLAIRKTDKNLWVATAAGALIATALVLPQSYVGWAKYGSVHPYPDHTILSKQLGWGYGAWHYETVHAPEQAGDFKWKGDFASNGFTPAVKSPAEYVEKVFERPKEVLSLWIGHVFSAFNFSQLKVYITDPVVGFSLFNVLGGAVLFLGFSTWTNLIFVRGRQSYAPHDFFVDALMIGSLAPLPFLAVETRFSYLAAMVLTYRFVQWLGGQNTRRAQDICSALLFGLLFAFAMTLVDISS